MNIFSIGGKGDTKYLSRHDFIAALNRDLNQPDFDFSQLPTPKNKDEYQQLLTFIQKQILPRLKH
ncbi:hypothetical protein [Secundilactobacillus silagei]|uniref:Uncharacterized protein n=1 Tax=Secundilactobacillus silagei JCM 19001 TaxID=1302250 RepID=A0A1Z5IIZ9_9LACO|nr:hypothetical protein [Secundilactobacillus silagei]TDG71077.1 hypothetical protein C5L25_001265 [Secundilactobacillus silagei JCM 19001]GAX01747.1 hypothetical protein IWT126_01790 [Secundilactobacillus silagei JCM 19001]